MTDADRVLTLVVALVCAFALGATGTSLEAAVSTSPDDVIDIEDTGLPISQENAREVRDQVENEQEEPDKEEVQQQQEQQEQQQQQQQQQEQQQPQEQGAATKPDEPSLWQQLLALLRDLFPYIVGTLVVVALAVAAYKQRHRLLALAALLVGDEEEYEYPDRGHRPLDFAPENDVDAAWVRLVSALGERARGARTTREYERAAVEAGLDPDAVGQVTRAFEEVRYGGQPVTDERRQRATEGIQRLGLGGGPA